MSPAGRIGQYFTELIDPQIQAGRTGAARILAKLYTWARPSDDLSWILLSRVYGALGDTEREERVLRAGLEHIDDSPMLQGFLASRLLARDSFEEAEQLIDSLKQGFPTSPYTWVWAAHLSARCDRLAEARAAVDRAIGLLDLDGHAGTAADCSVYLAAILIHKLDAASEAADLLDRVFKTGVQDARVAMKLGVLKELNGSPDADAILTVASGQWRGSGVSFQQALTEERRRYKGKV